MAGALDVDKLLAAAKTGVDRYLQDALKRGLIDAQSCRDAQAKTMPNLQEWLGDPHVDNISPNCKRGIAAAIEAEQWEALVNAFRQRLSFGTGGIRGMMAFDLLRNIWSWHEVHPLNSSLLEVLNPFLEECRPLAPRGAFSSRGARWQDFSALPRSGDSAITP